MKLQKIITIVLTILVPACLLVLLSSGLASAAHRQSGSGDLESVDRTVQMLDTDAALVPLVDEADLGIEKDAAPLVVTAGEQLTYLLTISNSGTVSATNVVVTDTLPASVTVDSLTASLGSSCTELADVVCQLGDLLVDASVGITIVVTVDPGAGGPLHNEAKVAGDGPENNTANNSDTLDTPVTTEADLILAKTDSPDPSYAGENISYTLTITNDGPSDATGVVVTDTLPSSTTLVSATPSQGPACIGSIEVSCAIGTIPAGDQVTVLIEVSVDETFAGVLTNEAEVDSATADPNNANNSATEDTTVATVADLTISKTGEPESVIAGEELAYHLIITNDGHFSATNVVVTDLLPAGTTVITASASQGACSLGSTVTCSLGTLDPGAWANVDIEVLVDASATGDLTNRAEAATDTKESDYENNDAELITGVEVLADLSIGKMADPDPALAGGLLTYSLVVNNDGPSDAIGVQISDTIPASTTFVSASIVQGAAVIHTIDTSLWDPSSPDPAGLAYIPAADELKVSDSEVEEKPFNRDENLFAATREGDLIRVATTTGFSNEPTGLAYDPDSETLFVSDDIENRVFMLLAGPDGVFGTADDEIDSFSTNDFFNLAPEGLAFDTDRGHLYSADGRSNVVFDISPGDDGIFGTADDVITSFDIKDLGIVDVEGIAYNPESQTIWIGDHRSPRVIETTVNGTRLRTFELSPDTIRVAGLTIAPSTANPGVLSLYVADRGVDNNDDPTENDGKIYEVAIPSSTSPGGFCSSGPFVQCDLGTVQAGGVAVVSVVVRVDVLASGTLTNTAEVESETPDDNSGNNKSTITTSITTRADLNLTKLDDPDPVVAGEQLTYTLVVSNPGPSNAQDVLLQDLLPANTTISSTLASQGPGCVGEPTVQCELGEIMAGNQATVTIFANVGASALYSLTNTAFVSSTTTDGSQADNFVTEVTTVTVQSDLAAFKTGWPLEVTAGMQLTYTVVVTNYGPSDARDVVVADTLPGGVITASFELSQGAGCTGDGVVVCDLGVLPAFATASVTMVVTVTPDVTGTLLNVADVASSSFDPNEANNQAQTLTPVNTSADISVSKQALADPVTAGTNLTYTIRITNAGPSDVAPLTLTDTLPSGVSFVAAAADRTIDCTGVEEVVCQLGPLTADSTAVVTLTAWISPALQAQRITNTARIASTTADPVATNNEAKATSTLQWLADLGVAKSISADTVPAGTPLTYVVTIENNGPSLASGIQVTDTLPGGVQLGSATVSQGGGCAGTSIVTCDLGDLAPSATATLTIVVGVDPGTLGLLQNSVKVSTLTQDDNQENNSAVITSTVFGEADLSIAKIGEPEVIIAGRHLTYTLTIVNHGPSDAVGVFVTDTLPPGVTLLMAEASAGPGCSDVSDIRCELGTVSPGSQATITLTAQVASEITTTLRNTAWVASDTADPAPENNEASFDTAVETLADLWMTKGASPEPAIAGDLLTYTLAISNAGPSDALGLVITDSLPAGVSLVAAAVSQGDGCAEMGQVVCDMGVVPVGQGVLVTITTRLDSALAPQPLVNKAGVSSETPDPDLANNRAEVTSAVQTESDLQIGKSAAPVPVTAGERLTYTLTVENLGPSDASGVLVTDTLPTEASLVSFAASQGNCSGVAIITCSLGSLAVFESAKITIVVDIDSAAGGTIENLAEVTGDQTDPRDDNNAVLLPTGVNREGALPVLIVDDPDPVTAGRPLTYTIVVSSNGPSNANNVVLTDTLPAGVQFITVTTSTGSCEQLGGTITCLIGDMPVSTEISIEIQVLVDTDTLGQISNQVKVTADDVEATTAHEMTTVVASADLSVLNQATPEQVTPGGVITFTIDITNLGPSMSRNVVVNNSLPVGVSFKSSPMCAQSNGSITCTIGDMDLNETRQAYFLVDVNLDADSPASSTATGLSDTPDPRPGNNSATAVSVIVPASDLDIGKTFTPTLVAGGETLTFTLTVTNHGPSEATGIQVIDTLPDEVVKLSATASQGSGCLGTSVILCSLGSLGNGHTATITIVVQIDEEFYGVMTNTAEIVSAIDDPDLTNNMVEVTIDVPQTKLYVYLPVIIKP